MTEALKNAHELRVPVHSNRETREVVGLEGSGAERRRLSPTASWKRLKVPALSGYYGVWSGALHSTYDAIHMRATQSRRTGQAATPVSARR